MIIKVQNETPFQVLSNSFTIGPSTTGYELQVGATSRDFTTLFTVAADTPRMVTNVANGSYFRLKNNSGEVEVNWSRTCKDEGGSGSGSSVSVNQILSAGTQIASITVDNNTTMLYAPEGGSSDILEPVSEFPESAETGTLVAKVETDSPGYWTDGEDNEKIFHPNTAWTGTTPITIASGNYYDGMGISPFEIKVFYDEAEEFCGALTYRTYDRQGAWCEICYQSYQEAEYPIDEEGNYSYKEREIDIDGEACLVVWKEDNNEGVSVENDMVFTDPVVQTLHTYQFDGENWVPYATLDDTEVMVNNKIFKGGILGPFTTQEELLPFLEANRGHSLFFYSEYCSLWVKKEDLNLILYDSDTSVPFQKARINAYWENELHLITNQKFFASEADLPEEPDTDYVTDFSISYNSTPEEGEPHFEATINEEMATNITETDNEAQIPVKYWNGGNYEDGNLSVKFENPYMVLEGEIRGEHFIIPLSIPREDIDYLSDSIFLKMGLGVAIYKVSYDPGEDRIIIEDKIIPESRFATINGSAITNGGNLVISGGGGSNVIELTQAEYDALVDKDPDTTYIISDAQSINMDDYASQADLTTLSGSVETALTGKADKANVTAGRGIPRWNEQGIITGISSELSSTRWIYVNGGDSWATVSNNGASRSYFIPTTAGSAGQPLLATGGEPAWGAYKFAFITQTEYDALTTPDSTTIYFIVGS